MLKETVYAVLKCGEYHDQDVSQGAVSHKKMAEQKWDMRLKLLEGYP